MAGDWLKIEVCTPDKPEVFVIAEQVKLEADAVVGKLIRVWSWFDQHTEKGNDASVTVALIDRVAGTPGFADGMRSAGWLRQGAKGLELPNFDRHNGKTAKTRALTAKRAATHRQRSNNGGVTHGALPREEKRSTPLVPPERTRKRPATAMPAQFEVDEGMSGWALGKGFTLAQIDAETEKFVAHHKAKGSTFSNWGSAWQNWLLKAMEYRGMSAAPEQRSRSLLAVSSA